MRSTKETRKETGISGVKDHADMGSEKRALDQKEETSKQPGEAVIAPPDVAVEDVVTSVQKDEANDGEAALQEARGEQVTSSSFALILKGWEVLAEAGARNVQRARENKPLQPLQMLQSLSLCGAGEGLGRIGGNPQIEAESGDPFEPIVLRHTHSTPLQYTPMFPDDDRGPAPPPSRLEHMSRSRSTPSTSAFRQRSEGSAFGTHLRSMPYLGGPDDRSAFTLPARHRNAFTSLSDSGVRYSAFAPVMLPQTATDVTENTAIEVMDVTPVTASDDTLTNEEVNRSEAHPIKGGTSRAGRFLRMSDARMRRRKWRSGRENPARPPSISSSSPGTDDKSKIGDSIDGEPISSEFSNPTTPESTMRKSTIDIDISTSRRASATVSFSTVHEADDINNENRADGTSGDPYHQLDSDIDEEYEHYQRIETSLQTDSPTPIPSPAYQRFEDEQVVQSVIRTGRTDKEGDIHTPNVRIEVSTGQSTPEQGSTQQEGSSLTPVSQDSGTARSMMTGNTSGHTTLATSTSATVSSGHMSVLSSVSETDIEVMETNQAGKLRIRRQRKLDQVLTADLDSSASVYSTSTGSTNTHGYVALAESPAPLRDGASLPVDRFFNQSSIPVRHSVSTNSGSSGSSGSATGPATGVFKASDTSTSPSKKTPQGQGSPASLSIEMAHTNSTGSSGPEEPLKFVSYLDRETKSKKNPLPPVDDGDERASPTEIVGYTEMVFEAATSTPGQTTQQPALIRPLQKRDEDKYRSERSRSRPPLSPIKGLRTPTTPPPSMTAVGGPDSTSPAYHQLSPPRNIIDHRLGAGLSKPYVLRSSARAGDGKTQIVVSPETDQGLKAKGWAQDVVTSSIISPEGAGPGLVDTYTASDRQRLGLAGLSDPEGDQIYEAMSIEVKNTDEHMSTPSPPLVSPEKGA
jgi:hypothetical protein